MPLNLPTVVKPVSQVLGDYIPTRPDNGIGIADAESVVAYIKTFPGVQADIEIIARPTSGGSGQYVDLKFLKDNCPDRSKPLQLSLLGTITLPQFRSGGNPGVAYATIEVDALASHVGVRLSTPSTDTPMVKAFLYEFGFTPAQVDSYVMTLPAVKAFISEYLSQF